MKVQGIIVYYFDKMGADKRIKLISSTSRHCVVTQALILPAILCICSHYGVQCFNVIQFAIRA